MEAVKIAREKDIEYVYDENGLARIPVLQGEYEGAAFERIGLKAGSVWKPEGYRFGDKMQFFIFSRGTGYITTPEKAYNIDEISIFIPRFDEETFAVTAASNLYMLHIIAEFADYDRRYMAERRITLPRFRKTSEAWTYWENFKNEGVVSRMFIEHRQLGRFSMGIVTGKGPDLVGEHVHHELEQWYYFLPGAKVTYYAGGESLEAAEGDVTYTRRGIPHGSRAEEGEAFDYIWFEIAHDGYPGTIS